MTHKVAFLDVMDAKVRDEIRSELPPGSRSTSPKRPTVASTSRWSPMPSSS